MIVPPQATGLLLPAVAEGAVVLPVMVIDEVAVQPLAAVTVTVYVPAAKPVMLVPVFVFELLHT